MSGGKDLQFSDAGIKMLTGFEAMVLHQYKDQVGVVTVCVGHVVKPADHSWIDDGVTRDECVEALNRDTAWVIETIESTVTVKLTQEMVDALGSLIFNIGSGNWRISTSLRLLNQGDYEGAAEAFKMWRYANVLKRDGTHERQPILLGRRQSERDLFVRGISHLDFEKKDEGPTLQQLIDKAVAFQFDLRMELLDEHGSPVEDDNEYTDDGKLVALPPDREDPLPVAA